MCIYLPQTSVQTRDKNAAISSNAQKSRVSLIYRKTLQRFSSPDFSDGDISDALFITPPNIVSNTHNTPGLRASYHTL